MLRVLVVDDSLLFRRTLSSVLSSMPDVEIVAEASNGRAALERIGELQPDLVTLDLEMPQVDGLQVLEALSTLAKVPAVIVVSSVTVEGSRRTLEALQRGAFDFVTKPEGASAEASRAHLAADLAPKVRELVHRKGFRSRLSGAEAPARREKLAHPSLVLVGVSTGGPQALARLLPALGPSVGVPVFVVQHMPAVFTRTLAQSLDERCGLAVKEAEHGETAQPDTVYVAAGGRHLGLVAGKGNLPVVQLSDAPAENNCRPSVDFLFRSAAQAFPGRSMAVILTGMGSDGTRGLEVLRRDACPTLAQDEASSVVWGMPRSAVQAGLIDRVLPLDALAPAILATLGRSPA